jgi:hypothetical protein
MQLDINMFVIQQAMYTRKMDARAADDDGDVRERWNAGLSGCIEVLRDCYGAHDAEGC